MAHVKKKIEKNIEKKLKVEKDEDSLSKQVKTSVIILLVIGLIVGAFLLKDYLGNKKEDTPTDKFQEIIAAQTFQKGTGTYYVVFYEFESEEDLSADIAAITEDVVLYKVNLKNKFNQDVISDKGNKKAKNSDELRINGPTIIKLESGNITDYLEGYSSVKSYIGAMQYEE